MRGDLSWYLGRVGGKSGHGVGSAYWVRSCGESLMALPCASTSALLLICLHPSMLPPTPHTFSYHLDFPRRLPARVSEDLRRVQRARSDLADGLGRPPSWQQLSEAAGVPEGRVRAALEECRQPASLDAPVAAAGGGGGDVMSSLKDLLQV